MAAKGAKRAAHRVKGEKRRKEEKALPTVVDVAVEIPGDKQVLLKGISTDRILDIRKLLAVHVETLHFTNYSLSHETRGDNLKESQEITALKPCVLELVEEDYTEEEAVAHVRRLLDIVSCTTSLGMSAKEREEREREEREAEQQEEAAVDGGKENFGEGQVANGEGTEGSDDVLQEVSIEGRVSEDGGEEGGESRRKTAKKVAGRNREGRGGLGEEEPGGEKREEKGERKLVPFKGKPEAAAAMAAAAAATEKGDMTGMCPHESKLGQFYDFLSASHLIPPVQSIKRGARHSSSKGEFFTLDVRLCTGKSVTVTANNFGFSGGRQPVTERTLMGLLQRISKAFAKAYADLQEFFVDRNKFGNTPLGFRSNTWLVPPPAAAQPHIFPQLPVEDAAWGGDGGGQGRVGDKLLPRDWSRDFQILASMPSKTVDDRLVRDRKAFLLHNLFVDTAIRRAVAAIEEVAGSDSTSDVGEKDNFADVSKAVGKDVVRRMVTDNMCITVMKDPTDASEKLVMKLDMYPEEGVGREEIAERCLLKGVTADESTAVHDTAALGTVLVRHRGYSVRVRAEASLAPPESDTGELEIEAQPEGGANTLNPNSLRTLLHSAPPSSASASLAAGPSASSPLGSSGQVAAKKRVIEEVEEVENLVRRVVKESLDHLETEMDIPDKDIRWELGACWVQHLQNPPTTEKQNAGGKVGEGKGDEKGQKVEKEGKSLKEEEKMGDAEAEEKVEEGVEEEDLTEEEELKGRMPTDLYQRLKESKTGLHKMTMAELKEGARIYYSDIALPKLVADFGSLELSPVDGRTLTDFMHTRGLKMRSLGKVAEKSENLPHVRSLCVHEMVTRACKHLLKAVISAAETERKNQNQSNVAAVIAATFNAILGTNAEKREGESGQQGQANEGRESRGEAERRIRSGSGERGDVEDANGAEREEEGTEWLGDLVWRWTQMFVRQRFRWEVEREDWKSLRKLAILRALCLKVGIEIAPRSYELSELRPFRAVDIISMFPIYKHVACTTADGRLLLESSKAALDKGRLDEAVACGTKALSLLVSVCGPWHRLSGGAYSLLAVVLYHTGDFAQATAFQQKALQVHERQLGLDHPDTAKSYGDLAVFYYRLQHTELALKYVNRALYLLHLTCGPNHPNTAATYINIAMMEEGLGNVHLALRYLHEALKCNKRLLGENHIQTAASYHAIAIALSLMEAYSLSRQHEQTTLEILRERLGAEDLRTQDAQAWLDYFDSKAVEQMESERTGGRRRPDHSIASKGHLSVSDLLDFINQEERERVERVERRKGGGKLGGNKVVGKVAGKVGGGRKGGEGGGDGGSRASGGEGSESGASEEEEEGVGGDEGATTDGGVISAANVAKEEEVRGEEMGEREQGKKETKETAEVKEGEQEQPVLPVESKEGVEGAAGAPSRVEEKKEREAEDEGWQEAGHKGRGSSGGAHRRQPGGRGGERGGERDLHHRGGGGGGGGGRHRGGPRNGGSQGSGGGRHSWGGSQKRVHAGEGGGKDSRGGGGGMPPRLTGAPPPRDPRTSSPPPTEGGVPPANPGMPGGTQRAPQGKPPSAPPLAAGAPPPTPSLPSVPQEKGAVAGPPAGVAEGSVWANRTAARLGAAMAAEGVGGVIGKQTPPPREGEGGVAAAVGLGKPAAIAAGKGGHEKKVVAAVASISPSPALPAGGRATAGSGKAVPGSGSRSAGNVAPVTAGEQGRGRRGGPLAVAAGGVKREASEKPAVEGMQRERRALSWKDVALAPPGSSSLARMAAEGAQQRMGGGGGGEKGVGVGAGSVVVSKAVVSELPNGRQEGETEKKGEASVTVVPVTESAGEAKSVEARRGEEGESEREASNGGAEHREGANGGQEKSGGGREGVEKQDGKVVEKLENQEGVSETEKEKEKEKETEQSSSEPAVPTPPPVDLSSRLSPCAPPFLPGATANRMDAAARNGYRDPPTRPPLPGKEARQMMGPTHPPYPPLPPNYPLQMGRPSPQFVPLPGAFRGPAGRPGPYPPPPPQMFHTHIPPPPPQNGYLHVMHTGLPPPPFMRHHPSFPLPPHPMAPPPPIYQGILRPPPGAYPGPLPPPPVGMPGVPNGVAVGGAPLPLPLPPPPLPPTAMNPLAQEFVPISAAASRKFNPLAAEFVPGLPWTAEGEGSEGEEGEARKVRECHAAGNGEVVEGGESSGEDRNGEGEEEKVGSGDSTEGEEGEGWLEQSGDGERGLSDEWTEKEGGGSVSGGKGTFVGEGGCEVGVGGEN